MRTDWFKRPALAVSVLLLSGGAPALAQDTLEAPAAVVEAPAAEAAAAPTGDRIAFKGMTVPRGQRVEGDVVAPFGGVRVDGEVMGSVTVGSGDLVLGPEGVIHGDAVVNGGGKLIDEGGRILGEMRVSGEASDDDDGAAAAADTHRAVGTHAVRIHPRGWLSRAGEGLGGVVSTITLGLILAAIGAALVFYARPQLERVSTVVRGDTLRSGALGVVATFFAIPAWILGAVLLVATIIGIPLLIVWLPLFFPALAALAGVGVVAVAHALGERTAEQSGSLEARHRNAYAYVFSGLVLVLAPILLGNLLQVVPFIGWIGGLVEGLGWLALWIMACVGFGAVFLTRGGTRAGWPWTARAYEYDPIFDREPAFDPAPGRASDV